jgi:hypothetical protein
MNIDDRLRFRVGAKSRRNTQRRDHAQKLPPRKTGRLTHANVLLPARPITNRFRYPKVWSVKLSNEPTSLTFEEARQHLHCSRRKPPMQNKIESGNLVRKNDPPENHLVSGLAALMPKPPLRNITPWPTAQQFAHVQNVFRSSPRALPNRILVSRVQHVAKKIRHHKVPKAERPRDRDATQRNAGQNEQRQKNYQIAKLKLPAVIDALVHARKILIETLVCSVIDWLVASNRESCRTMRCFVVKRKVSYDPLKDGITTYHAALFHGNALNKKVDDNNLGDPLNTPLRLEKDVYDCTHIIQPDRNLVIPESVKRRLAAVSHIAFYAVIFEKLFFFPYKAGELSIGPEDSNDMESWLDSFPGQPSLTQEIEPFYELVLPSHERITPEFSDGHPVEFNLLDWKLSIVELSASMLRKYAAIWTVEGTLFREDVFNLVEPYFSWTFFNKGEFDLPG